MKKVQTVVSVKGTGNVVTGKEIVTVTEIESVIPADQVLIKVEGIIISVVDLQKKEIEGHSLATSSSGEADRGSVQTIEIEIGKEVVQRTKQKMAEVVAEKIP